MTNPGSLSEATPAPWPQGPHPILLRLNYLCLALLVFTGAFVIFEWPYNAAFILAALAMLAGGGARINAPLAPMILITLVYVAGGLASLLPKMNFFLSQRYVVTIFFLACTCFYFAIVVQEETSKKLAIIRNATIASAMIACFVGLVGYFDVAGLAQSFRVYAGRASGTFNDPNVFGSFLVFPAMLLMQDVLIGDRRALWWRALGFLLVALMIFLSFSRGSWVVFALASVMLVVLTAITERDKAGRLIVMGLIAFAVFAILVAAILSIDDIWRVFEERAQLTQSYDEGRTGRFGKILYSLPMLFDNPNGLGPLRYGHIFGEDPHNVYVNGFANFGWVGGVAYLALIAMTCFVGFRHVFQASPWRREAIAVWCALFMQILQGVQIDTNTWRHFNMMIGLIWGMMAAWAMMRRRAAAAASLKSTSSAMEMAPQGGIPASAIIAAR